MATETPTLTSVGIDIGTTTTQLIISELTLSTTGLGAVNVEIEDTNIVYRGTIYETPLLDHQTLDVDAIAELVTTEFETVGCTPANIDSGAVIVTGESSYKTNAEELVRRIAADAGEFVVAAAGPELESVLAGTGSGAAAWAREHEATILNVDIGGGTTNMCLFTGDSVVETRCLDVGGRLLRFDSSGELTHISAPAAQLLETAGLSMEIGSRPTKEELRELAALMAEAVFETIDGTGRSSTTKALTIGDGEYASRSLDGICVSGGVGQLIASGVDSDMFAYQDFGNFLAAAIRDRLASYPVAYRSPNETIRATVIGAGTQTTSFSGTTVSLDEDALPLRNLPVLKASLTATDCGALAAEVCQRLEHGLALHETQQLAGLALALPDVGSLSYDRMQTLAQALTQGYADAGYSDTQLPVVIVVRQNCAKALAQCLRATSNELSPLVVIDEIAVSDGDYLDIGEPMLSSQTVPVVVKSLVFGSDSADE